MDAQNWRIPASKWLRKRAEAIRKGAGDSGLRWEHAQALDHEAANLETAVQAAEYLESTDADTTE